jgi:chromosome segregation ATPase
MKPENEDARFTIRDEENAPDSLYVADAENLRIEKLSTRITLVAVLIPCLLVIVVTIAYLDIKNRVVKTQNTGSMGVQNLAKDLESRFSSLSLKQAKIEKALAEKSQTLDTAAAGLQVNLKKATAELKRVVDAKPDRSALDALEKKTEAGIAALRKEVAGLDALRKEIAGLNAALGTFDDELADQIQIMADGLKKDRGRLEKVESKTRQLEAEKLGKSSMELSLRLERLAVQEMVKEQIRDVRKKLAAMDRRIENLSQRLEKRVTEVPVPPPGAPAVPESKTQPSPSKGIVEQTID